MYKPNDDSHALERIVPGTQEWVDLHADHLSRYYFAAAYVEGRRVLDAGTGPGYGAAMLKEVGARHVQAVDICQDAIDEAKGRFPLPNLEFFADNCETFANVHGPVDMICSFENIEHLRRPEDFVAAAARILAPDGVLLCSTPDRTITNAGWVNGRPANQFHINEWYCNEFRMILEAGFEQVDIRAQVESVALNERRKAGNALREHLTYLWSDPVLRSMRGIQKLTGNVPHWGEIDGLTVASPTDYPIVPRVLIGAAGTPWCHYAICRRPRK